MYKPGQILKIHKPGQLITIGCTVYQVMHSKEGCWGCDYINMPCFSNPCKTCVNLHFNPLEIKLVKVCGKPDK